jgi:hypothetical protein
MSDCTDVCESLIGILRGLGFPIKTGEEDQDHADVLDALANCVIMKGDEPLYLFYTHEGEENKLCSFDLEKLKKHVKEQYSIDQDGTEPAEIHFMDDTGPTFVLLEGQEIGVIVEVEKV